MKFIFLLFIAIFFMLSPKQSFSQNKLPYPVIFVHGLTGSDQTFQETMEFFRDQYKLGSINVFDVVLNADNDQNNAYMWHDVRWENFTFKGRNIKCGRRNFANDIDDFESGWKDTNLFAINFKEERIRGAQGTCNDYFDGGNQSAIFKQGYALRRMIEEVLYYTGAEKVILVGHSMGGLCIREYLQRTSSWGTHVNWVDPYTEAGHKVARVTTIGTPHLGSNTGFDPSKNDKSIVPNGASEAMRDMKWQFDGYTNCGGTPKGIYLFGGYENCIKNTTWNTTFLNVDINCNGSEDDYIVGISNGTSYNPYMELPQNIKYTWITSIWANWGGNLYGDGAVNIHRQWLYEGNTPAPVGITDTLLTNVFHTSEGSQYKYIIRGMDEPSTYSLAYNLKLWDTNIGHITYQSNMRTLDIDMYSIDCSNLNTAGFSIDGWYTGVYMLAIYDENGNWLASKSVNTFPAHIYANVPNGTSKIYFKVIGQANNYTWRYPYKIRTWTYDKKDKIAGISKVETLTDVKLYPTLATKNVTIKFNSENEGSAKVNIIDVSQKELYFKNFKINLGINETLINVSQFPAGIYFVNINTENYKKTLKLIKK